MMTLQGARDSEVWKAQQKEVAALLLGFSSALELNQTEEGYISLQVAPTGLKNAVTISSKPFEITVLLRNEELVTKLRSKFRVELEASPRTAAFAGVQHRVFGVSNTSISENEELFRKLVAESVEIILELRKGVKHG